MTNGNFEIGIILIAFNRPNHLNRLLNSLKVNECFVDFPVILALDGPRKAEDLTLQEKMLREQADTIEQHPAFKVSRRETNIGSKRHIIETVSRQLTLFDAVIVLEDDLEVGTHFLSYMRAALTKYRDCKEVYHISGFSHVIGNKVNQSFFIGYMNCWGWGTWRDRWEKFNDRSADYIHSFSREDRRIFNCNGSHDFFRQIVENHHGILDTWAIFWYATIFYHGGLCLTPGQSLVNNIGRDGSGERFGRRLGPANVDIEITAFPEALVVDAIEEIRLSEWFENQKTLMAETLKRVVYLLPYTKQKAVIRRLLQIRELSNYLRVSGPRDV